MKIINLDMPLVNGGDARASFSAIIDVDGESEAIGLDSTSHNWNKAKEAIDAFIASERGEKDNEALAEKLYRLVNMDAAVAEKITLVQGILDGRMAVENGHVTIDHDSIDPVLEAHILRLLKDDGTPKDRKNWAAFARFVEKLYTNTDEFVRKQLFGWLNYETMTGRGFTLTSDGNFIGYKGCAGTADEPRSIHHGSAYVDGVFHQGAIPNKVGSTVEMKRSSVQNNPAVGCSYGLHVGTYDYAKGWAQGVLLTVIVDPRDVVSVPVECEAQKIRVCRYKVLDTTEVAYTESTYYAEDDEDTCPRCGEEIFDYCENCDTCTDCCTEDYDDESACECCDEWDAHREDEDDAQEDEEIPEDNTSHEREGKTISFDYVERNGKTDRYTINIVGENDYSITGTLGDSGMYRMFIKENMSNITTEDETQGDSMEDDAAQPEAEEKVESPFDAFIKEAKQRAEELRTKAQEVRGNEGNGNPFDMGKLFGDAEATNPLAGVMDNLKKLMEEGAVKKENPLTSFQRAMENAQEQAERQRREATQKKDATPDTLGEIKSLFEDLFKAPGKDDESK